MSLFLHIHIYFPTFPTCVSISPHFNTISDINQHPNTTAKKSVVSSSFSSLRIVHILLFFVYTRSRSLVVFDIYSHDGVPIYMYIGGIKMNEHVMNKFSLLFFLLYFSFVCWPMNEPSQGEWERTNRLRRRCIVCSQDQHKSALRCRVKANWRSAYARERENERIHVGQFWWAAAASLSLFLCVSVFLPLSVIQREGHRIAVQSEHAALLSIAPPVCVTHIQRFDSI